MAFVHPSSCECTKAELDLFSIPPTQTAIERSYFVEHRPLTTVDDGGPIEFIITGSGDEYTDLSETYLQITAKIVKPDGSKLQQSSTSTTNGGQKTTVPGVDEGIAPVNNWLHSLFSQVDVSLNERLITPSTNTYPYRAYIETLLSFGSDAKETQLQLQLWYKDTANQMDTKGSDNYGFKHRREHTFNSKQAEMFGKIHLDLSFQEKPILNGVDIKMRLVRSKDAFNLMGEGKVVIKSASLFVRKIRVNPSVQLGHIKALERASAKYPIRRVETKVFSVPEGNLSMNQENLFLGQLPKRLILGMVNNKAFSGHKDKNPFHFKHYNVDFLALYVDGVQVPSKPLKPTFGDDLFIRCYSSLFMGTGQMGRDDGNDISRYEYAHGYTLFAFDLTPDMDDGGHFHLIKQGSLRLEMHFAEALPETINTIVYAEFDNIIEIDRARNVLFDYSA